MLERLAGEIPRFFNGYTVVFLLQAMGTTLLMTLIGCILGFLLGFGIALLRQMPGLVWVPLRLLAVAYVEFFRRIPFLVILYLVLFFIQAFTPDASLFAIAVVGICLLSIACTAEIIRTGLESVPRQQIEAGVVMNFSRWQLYRHVIVPQAWPVILPPAFAYMVGFIKDTALVSQIGVVELTFAGKVLNNRGYSALLVFGTVLLLYFALSYPLTRLGQWLEARLASSRDTPAGERLR
jgi:polar amino acid transport system permease protein